MDQTIDQQQETSTPKVLPKWLQKLHNESWQAEMLISGGAVLSLFSTYDLLEEVLVFMEFSTKVSIGIQGTISKALGSLVFFLIVGFSVHLLLRGFWIM
jgi:hypothetical protein